MQAVEDTGRLALGELRHLLGVLRPEAEDGALDPQPGTAQIPALVNEFREAGLDVTLTLEAVPPSLPAQVDVSAYRITQEALTNVLKHAGGDVQASVELSSDEQGLTISVADDGVGGVAGGPGHGVVGMQERAALLGGSLSAGPGPHGGFRVDAHLPYAEVAE